MVVRVDEVLEVPNFQAVLACSLANRTIGGFDHPVMGTHRASFEQGGLDRGLGDNCLGFLDCLFHFPDCDGCHGLAPI